VLQIVGSIASGRGRGNGQDRKIGLVLDVQGKNVVHRLITSQVVESIPSSDSNADKFSSPVLLQVAAELGGLARRSCWANQQFLRQSGRHL
jgi:hypothetical protein